MPPRPDWNALCDRHPELRALPEALVRTASRRAFVRNERLFLTRETPREMLFLLHGEVRLVRQSHDGGEVILQRTGNGFIAEASLGATGYHCDAVATEAGELLGFPIGPFRRALQTPRFRDFWIARLSGEVRGLRARCERLTLNGTAERVIHYLQCEARDGVVRLTQSKKAWAAELGVTHESLYRTLAALQRSGRISVDGPRLTLLRR